MSTYWWMNNDGKPTQRLAAEVIAMKKAFDTKKDLVIRPHVPWDTDFLVKTERLILNRENPDQLYWSIDFRMQEIHGVRPLLVSDGLFKLQILYVANFPASEPQCNFTEPDTTGALHKFKGGKLCLHGHSSARNGWDPAKSTAATMAVWSVHWARAWLSWKKTGNWPNAS